MSIKDVTVVVAWCMLGDNSKKSENIHLMVYNCMISDLM